MESLKLKNQVKVYIFLLFILSSGSVIGQTIRGHEHCGTIYNPKEMDKDKARSVDRFYQRVNELINSKDQSESKGTLQSNNFNPYSGVILIPVVVHVVHKTTAQNISDAQICSQIRILNEDYARRNADASQTPAQFLGVSADTEIQFVLASRDENNNVTTGITRTATTVTSFDDPYVDNIKNASTGGADPWDPDSYLNIWVGNLQQGLIGYAAPPWDYSTYPELDGVVIDYMAFGDTGSLLGAYNLGRTTSHEVGHWLGLKHIWGDENGCSGSDDISDTPNQAMSYIEQCPSTNQVSCSSNDMYMNFMDYTDDACKNLFTQGQKLVMRAVLNTGGYRQNFNYYLPYISSSTDVVCTSTTQFKLLGFPTGTPVTWDIEHDNLIQPSYDEGIGATANTRAQSGASGIATLNFRIGDQSCTNTNILMSKEIQVGPFNTSQITVSGQSAVCPGDEYVYTATPFLGHNSSYSYSWTRPSGWTVLSQTANQIRLRVPSSNPSGGAVRASVNNGCGASGFTGITVYPIFCGYYSYGPNPTHEELFIEFDAVSDYTIKLVNEDYIEVYHENFYGHSMSIKTNKIKAGNYYLIVSSGNVEEASRIIIKD